MAIVGDIDRLADEDRPWLGVRTARFVLVALRLDGVRQSQSFVACHPADLQVVPVGCRRVIARNAAW